MYTREMSNWHKTDIAKKLKPLFLYHPDVKKYCEAHELSMQKLEKTEIYPFEDYFLFAIPPEVEGEPGVFLSRDRDTQPKALLAVKINPLDGSMEIFATDDTNELRAVSDRKNDFVYRFPEEEVIAGHKFKHIGYGLYEAEPSFDISEAGLKDLLRQYRDLVILHHTKGQKKKTMHVYYAYSKEDMRIVQEMSFLWNTFYFMYKEDSNHWKLSLDEWDWLQESSYNKKKLDRSPYDFCEEDSFDLDLPETELPEEKYAMRCILPKDIAIKREDWPGAEKIWFRGFVGQMIEEGIYCFENPYVEKHSHERARPRLDLENNDIAPAAVVGYQIFAGSMLMAKFTGSISVKYLALDEKYYPKLREIVKGKDSRWARSLHYYELKEKTEEK